MKIFLPVSIVALVLVSSPAIASDNNARVEIGKGVVKIFTKKSQIIPYCSSHPQSGLSQCTNNCGNLYQLVMQICGGAGLSDQDRITCYEEAQQGVNQCDEDCVEQCMT